MSKEILGKLRALENALANTHPLACHVVNEAAHLIRSLQAGAQRKDEVAWLIEMPDARWGTGYFWCGSDGFKHSSGSWGVIEKAIRFSRKEDAENVIKGINSRFTRSDSLMRLEACEHMWPALSLAAATPPEK